MIRDIMDHAAVDKLDQLIISKRQTRNDLRRQIELLDVEIQTLELAASLRPLRPASAPRSILPQDPQPAPATSPGVAAHAVRPAGGRQPGSLTKRWQEVLSYMAILHPDGATDAQILEIAHTQGIKGIRIKDARTRIESYEPHNYVRRTENGWVVTDTAARRFKLELPRPETKEATDSQSVASISSSSEPRQESTDEAA